MPQAVAQACRSCGRANTDAAFVCQMCGEVLRRASLVQLPWPTQDVQPALAEIAETSEPVRDPTTPWIYLGIGLVTAPIFALTPLVGFMGWFLASLVHEMGHCTVAWFFGTPAFPAISLEGHACSVHSESYFVFALCVGAMLGGVAWHFLAARARWIALACVGLIYPALAFTGAKELLMLLGGHGGELAFATICLWKALDGGFTESRLERGLYGTVGWFLVGSNVRLCAGLMFSSASREEYAGNGSFGCTNDMIRVAEDVLGWRLQSVAALMLVVSLAVLPIALWLWRISSRRDESAGWTPT